MIILTIKNLIKAHIYGIQSRIDLYENSTYTGPVGI